MQNQSGVYAVAIGRRLQNELKKQNISQVELARRCDLSEAAISRYLSGERLMRIDQLVQISDELGISIQYLVTGVK